MAGGRWGPPAWAARAPPRPCPPTHAHPPATSPSEGIQLLMNVNGYFAHVAALDDEAAAQGQALAEWPPFWVPHVQRALLWGVANLTARELVIKCLK